MEGPEIRSRVAGMTPDLLADLERLVGISSVAFPGCPSKPVERMANEALRLFREAGFASATLQEVPTGCPLIYGEMSAFGAHEEGTADRVWL